MVEQIDRADQIGLDVFGVGEHHRREFLDSAPVVILGAAAARMQRIRLTSVVTVLSAADPVRVFQEFATLDLLSQGRAEMVVGRGSSIEAFPLFGVSVDTEVRTAERVAGLVFERNLGRVNQPKDIHAWLHAMLYKPEYAALPEHKRNRRGEAAFYADG